MSRIWRSAAMIISICACRKGSLGSIGDGISFREISTRGALHAWSWPEMVRKARAAFYAEFRALIIE
jgi:hypothetical protein